MFTLLMEFARTPGAKDKQPRKKRNLIAESSAVGAAGLAAANPMLKRQQSLLNSEKRDLTARRESNKDFKDYLADYKNRRSYSPDQQPLLDRKVQMIEKLDKRLQPRIKQNARDLSLVKAGKKVSKYGAMGLAGVAGVELARRGINKIRTKGQ